MQAAQHRSATVSEAVTDESAGDADQSYQPVVAGSLEGAEYRPVRMRWPRSGEIDIMEFVNRSDKLYGTCHYGGEHGDIHSGARGMHSGARAIFPGHNFTENYHLYAIEWEPREICWYVDNHYYGCITNWNSASAAFPAPFDQKFYIIINYAVGGDWPKDPDTTSIFPQSMHVKYVRVYQPH